MPIYHQLGSIPRKRHIAHRSPEGSLYHEHLMGNFGFTGPSSLSYHLRPPTAVRAMEPLRPIALAADPEAFSRHRHFRTRRLPPGGSPTLDRTPLLFNGDLVVLAATPDRQDEHFYRNGIADEYVFVAEGGGTLQSTFGDLPIRAGDQLVIHRGILHRYRFDDGPTRLLVVESRSYLRWPTRYRGSHGQLLEGAPFSERDIRRPVELTTVDEAGEHEIVVRQDQGLTRMVLDHHPCDVVGWDGFYYPWAFNIHDFEPITGTIHQPPPIHQLLQGDAHVVCNFCPRPYDFHPEAIPAPYHHSNVMTDEVLYYASSEFMSRKGIEFGSITLHPDGMPHGPQPGRYEGSIGQPRTDELAVMIDTFRPLAVTREAYDVEDPDYLRSWLS
ncbi:MAG: homogentisate 1,2-dioxygenase [Deltaproteobacteria bacterium]|jgi:homogentisate 1,2-dioxygenase|nr:homogentisate 1,2-dioxygenase [Deltaproteobacteria bacterium]MBW2537651.1 homogentisate 1,2-dioxygenase [Deltaproteobacteria bacterium]